MVYKTDLLYHVRVIQNCAPRFKVRTRLDLLNLRLTVTGRNRYYDFFPQFVGTGRDGGLQYMPILREEATGFIGWLPYFNKKWPLAKDKMLFKDFCTEKGLPTPRYWTQPDNSVRDFIIKQYSSSFGKGIRGPFKSLDSANAQHKLLEKEYYEQFVMGTIAKAWYWEDKLACLEMFPMPTVTGDGKHSMYELIAAEGSRRRPAPERAAVDALAQYQGVALDYVVPADKRVVADFRYVSTLMPRSHKSSNVLPKYAGTEIARQFAQAGPVLWDTIPEDIRRATLWTLDAMVEEDAGRVWLLEMNCNPMVHPDAYFSMFEGLFGPAEAVAPSIAPDMHPPMGAPGVMPPGVPGAIPHGSPPGTAPPGGNGRGIPRAR